MHRFLSLQLKQVDTSVVTEDLIVVRDQVDQYSLSLTLSIRSGESPWLLVSE